MTALHDYIYERAEYLQDGCASLFIESSHFKKPLLQVWEIQKNEWGVLLLLHGLL